MKETQLRTMIKNQIMESLKESPEVRSNITTGLGRIEKMAGVKMLKKALGQGGPAQQAAGLHAVVRSISGDNPHTAKLLSRLLLQKGISADTPEAPLTPGAPVEEKVSSALTARMGRVDKTQAMKMMKKAWESKN